MCLLIVMSQTEPDLLLVVGANRDERLDRDALPMDVLREAGPRILGGRDLLAGGTWLAVNEHGVVAGLTNRPAAAGRDATLRSRGELPLALAAHTSAASAVEAFAREVSAADYNRSWLVVADRTDVFTVDMSGDGAPDVQAVGPGLHIVENSAPGSETLKVAHVRALLDGAVGTPEERVAAVLANHERAPGAVDVEGGRPAFATAPCVHSENYGTRWSGVVTVPVEGLPLFRHTDGPPCTSPFVDALARWSS